MTPAQLALTRAEARLVARLAELEERLAAGEDCWTASAGSPRKAWPRRGAVVGMNLPRVRDSVEGRQRIAAELARLREWCLREEVPWVPVGTEDAPAAEAADVR